MKNKRYCLNCKKEIGKKSIRCHSCQNKTRCVKHLWKCIECGKQVSRKDAKRCRSCASRKRFIDNNPACRIEVKTKMSKIRKGRKLTKE